MRFDGSKCSTCPTNCCVIHDPDEQYIAIREDELAAIYAAYPDAVRVQARKKGKDGRRYYTVSKKGARCGFLGDDMRCTVYEARPRYCRENPGNPYQIHGWDGVAYDLKRCPGTTYEKPVLCLSSGGISSLVLQAQVKALGFTPYTLFIDYGQAELQAERAAAERIAAYYQGKFYSERLTLDVWKALPRVRREALHEVFFSIAATYCDTLGIPRLALMWKRRRKGLKILTPLSGKAKASIVRLGEKYGAPFELAYPRSESSESKAAGSRAGSSGRSSSSARRSRR